MNEMVDRVLEIMQSRGLMADESDARAVIEEMREPTEAMLSPYGGLSQTPISIGECEAIWRAMIDAALRT